MNGTKATQEALEACLKTWEDPAFLDELKAVGARKGVYTQTLGGTLDVTSDASVIALSAVCYRTGRTKSLFIVANPTPEALEVGKADLLATLELLPDAPTQKEWGDALLAVLREEDGLLGPASAAPHAFAWVQSAGGQWVVTSAVRAARDEPEHNTAMIINPDLDELRTWSRRERVKLDSLRRRTQRLGEIFGNPAEHIDALAAAWIAAGVDDAGCPEHRADVPREVRREVDEDGDALVVFEAPRGGVFWRVGVDDEELFEEVRGFQGFINALVEEVEG